MKKIILSLFILCGLAINVLQAQDLVNDANAKVRTLNASFTGINVSSGVELILTNGNQEALAVSISDEKYADRFKTEVVDGTLKIYFDSKGFNWNGKEGRNKKLKAYVSYKTLNKLHGSAGARVIAKSAINADNFDMSFTSGSTFEGTLNASDVNVDQNSGASVKLSGKANKLVIDISSGAMLQAYDMKVDYCNAKASSGADVQIGVNKEISGKASSGASVRYKGDAVKADTHTNSGGIIKKA